MNKQIQKPFAWNLIIPLWIGFAVSACTINVNLAVSTDKPIAVNLNMAKPIEVKLGADIAVTKLPPIEADAKIGFTDKTPTKTAP
jgi:hypothetical protein